VEIVSRRRERRRRRRGLPRQAGPGRVTQKHVEAFTRELATCWRAGCRWRGRCIFAARDEGAGAAAVVESIYEDVVGGTPLAGGGLRAFRRFFSSV